MLLLLSWGEYTVVFPQYTIYILCICTTTICCYWYCTPSRVEPAFFLPSKLSATQPWMMHLFALVLCSIIHSNMCDFHYFHLIATWQSWYDVPLRYSCNYPKQVFWHFQVGKTKIIKNTHCCRVLRERSNVSTPMFRKIDPSYSITSWPISLFRYLIRHFTDMVIIQKRSTLKVSISAVVLPWITTILTNDPFSSFVP